MIIHTKYLQNVKYHLKFCYKQIEPDFGQHLEYCLEPQVYVWQDDAY